MLIVIRYVRLLLLLLMQLWRSSIDAGLYFCILGRDQFLFECGGIPEARFHGLPSDGAVGIVRLEHACDVLELLELPCDVGGAVRTPGMGTRRGRNSAIPHSVREHRR
eukprot:g1584.t1